MKWILLLVTVCFVPTGLCYLSSWLNSVVNVLGYEVCDDKYISPDFYKLQRDLKEKLFGQDIIIDKLVPAVETHFKFEPKKALVICMHGWTGSGKNYAAKIVIDNLFRKKSESEFVKMYNGRLHFPLESKTHVDEYKTNVQSWIRGNVTKCPRSLFVFDEVDKMPAGIIDSVKPFFDYHENIDRVNFRKSIFVFISNTGAEVINKQYMELWRQGRSREDMRYKDFEPLLRQALYHAEGGFKGSATLEDHLVSLYLPFLPLGEDEVRKCVKAESARQGVGPVSENYVVSVLEEMQFNSDRFSTSGCKRVADIVASIKYKKINGEL